MADPQNELYLGSYAAADQPGIYHASFSPESGALELRTAYTGIANPSFLVLHPAGEYLYAVSEGGDGGMVWAFRRGAAGLEALNQQPSGGSAPCHLTIDREGRWLVVSNYVSGTITLLPILADGSLGEPSDTVAHEGHGPNTGRQEGPHAHSAQFSPDKRFLIAADLGIDQLVVYVLDWQAGKLLAHSQGHARPGAGPRHMVFRADGMRLYVANELDCTVSVYAFDTAAGLLHELQVLPTLPADAPANTVADIHLSADGSMLYVSNRGHESIASYHVAADGSLSAGPIFDCGGRTPRNFAIAPGGQWLIVANQGSGDVVVLPVAGGAAVSSATVPGACCVQFVA